MTAWPQNRPHPSAQRRIGIRERFGLAPLRPALADARRAIFGNPYTLATRWDLSSLRIFKPQISIPTWLGRTRPDRKVPVYNLFNREMTPRGDAYSVKVTYARDFLGGRWTYDSHIGTDFAVPIGTPIVAGTPGLVLRIANEIDHGGLKVCIDHGQALFTTSSHLSRALVREGECVGRGQIVGLSGASGIEFILFFPWVAPHLHYNVWLNGEPIDPFAVSGETSMWRQHNDPVPYDDTAVHEEGDFAPSAWDSEGVEAGIDACRDPEMRDAARAFETLERRAAEVLFMRNLRSSAFEAFPALYRETGERRPCLDLPFRREDFIGVAFPESGRS